MSQQLPDRICSCFSSVALCYRLPVPHQVWSLVCEFLKLMCSIHLPLHSKVLMQRSACPMQTCKSQWPCCWWYSRASTVALCITIISIPDHLLHKHASYWPIIWLSAGADGSSVTYYAECLSNMFVSNSQQQSAASNKEGMVCPGLLVSRPDTVTNQSVSYYNNIVLSDPLLYSYRNCTCASPLVAHYYIDTVTGTLQVESGYIGAYMIAHGTMAPISFAAVADKCCPVISKHSGTMHKGIYA